MPGVSAPSRILPLRTSADSTLCSRTPLLPCRALLPPLCTTLPSGQWA